MQYDFYKENDTDRIWWVNTVDRIGLYLFSFDRKKIYNLFSDYPHKLSRKKKGSSTKKIRIGKHSSGLDLTFPPTAPF